MIQQVGVSVMDAGNPALGATQYFRLSAPALARAPSIRATFGDSGVLNLRIDGEVGPWYRLQASTNFTSWNELGQFLPTEFPWTWMDEGTATAAPWRFFRVVAEPAPVSSP